MQERRLHLKPPAAARRRGISVQAKGPTWHGGRPGRICTRAGRWWQPLGARGLCTWTLALWAACSARCLPPGAGQPLCAPGPASSAAPLTLSGTHTPEQAGQTQPAATSVLHSGPRVTLTYELRVKLGRLQQREHPDRGAGQRRQQQRPDERPGDHAGELVVVELQGRPLSWGPRAPPTQGGSRASPCPRPAGGTAGRAWPAG